MTSALRIAANRRNALRSTGPRTPAGKTRSAQNARRHGLNRPAAEQADFAQAIWSLAHLIAGEGVEDGRLAAAYWIAAAQIDVMRVRRAHCDLFPMAMTDFDMVSRLAALDFYERRAWARRDKAMDAFDAACWARVRENERNTTAVPADAPERHSCENEPNRVAVRANAPERQSCENEPNPGAVRADAPDRQSCENEPNRVAACGSGHDAGAVRTSSRPLAGAAGRVIVRASSRRRPAARCGPRRCEPGWRCIRAARPRPPPWPPPMASAAAAGLRSVEAVSTPAIPIGPASTRRRPGCSAR